MTTMLVGSREVQITPDVIELFWAKVDKGGPGGCWVWTARLTAGGYGAITVKRVSVSAHRLSFLLSGEDLEPGLVIDHICFNRACVNPDHLRQVTAGENGAYRSGGLPDSASGIRSVFPTAGGERWLTVVLLRGFRHRSFHASVDRAELAAIQKRIELGMENPSDLIRLPELLAVVGELGDVDWLVTKTSTPKPRTTPPPKPPTESRPPSTGPGRRNLTGGAGESPRITIRLTPGEHAALARESIKAGVPVTTLVRRAVTAFLAARAD